jgi:hypothetical protein
MLFSTSRTVRRVFDASPIENQDFEQLSWVADREEVRGHLRERFERFGRHLLLIG